MEVTEKLITLVAEDDEDDALLLKRAFKKAGVDMPIHICLNGEEAMSYLKGEGPFADRIRYPFPRVLITDLKMPRCTGFDVLRWLKDHPECNLIPKIVLSASAEPRDVKLAYQLGANTYFKKPTDFNDLLEIVKLSQNYWTTAIMPELPRNC